MTHIKISDITWVFRGIYFCVLYGVWYSLTSSEKGNRSHAYVLKFDYYSVYPICTIIRVVSLKKIILPSDKGICLWRTKHCLGEEKENNRLLYLVVFISFFTEFTLRNLKSSQSFSVLGKWCGPWVFGCKNRALHRGWPKSFIIQRSVGGNT